MYRKSFSRAFCFCWIGVQVMFTGFFYKLKDVRIPVSLREYLTLMEALEADLADKRVEDFYYLSRAILVKILESEEEHIDHLETQLDLINKVGEQNYLQSQMYKGEDS
mgnify:CR=1 FL=1